MSTNVRLLQGIGELMQTYDGFLIDIWGVLHDGERAFPDAVRCLDFLRRSGKGVGLVSNAPRRSATIAGQLATLGIPARLYDFVITSGELARAFLIARRLAEVPWTRCWFMGPPHNLEVIEGLDPPFQLVDAETADFILHTNAFDPSDTMDRYRSCLTAALARHLPMVCANPDLTCIIGTRRVLGAGRIAHEYQAMGGHVMYFGKPLPAIHHEAMRRFADIERERLIVVGDSLQTDILGANSAGMDSVLVLSGVECAELTRLCGPEDRVTGVSDKCFRLGIWPRYVIERLSV